MNMQWSMRRLEVGMRGLHLKRVQDRKGETHEADPRDESVSPDGAVINRSFIAAIQSSRRNCVGDMKFDDISKR